MMATGMPELGSKISLISKADIRYEGRLFTVDPQECTIALASVRSFGTEDRDTQFPVPAQNQVYDYILFRGSDIKDIRVVNSVSHPQPLNDPAIMQLSVPPSLGAQPFQPHPILGHMGPAPYSSFLPMGGLTGAASGLQAGMSRAGSSVGGSKPSELIISPPGVSAEVGVPPASIISPPPAPVGEQPRPNDRSDLIGGVAASRSATPASVASRKSISVDQGTQAGSHQQRDGNKRQVKPIQPPRGQYYQGQYQQGQYQQRNKSGERKDSNNHRNYDQENNSSQNYQNQGRPQSRGRPQNQNHQGGYQQYNRGGWNNQRGGTVPRGRGRPKTGPFRAGGPPGQGQGNNKKTLKFDSEYDFEQANTEFEELRTKLAKIKLDEASGSKVEVNGAATETEKKEDSGNETGAGEPEPEEDNEIFYDKKKSFFDKISCEAVERAKGKMQRTDWRQERKLNSETFGVAATRRGNYRGRGGFRGGFRGGYRGGYNNRYPQQRRPNEQQQTNQQNQQENKEPMHVFAPLTGGEAIAKKKEELKKLQDGETSISIIENKNLGLANKSEALSPEAIIVNDKIIEQGPTDSVAEKILQDDNNVAAADQPACIGQ